MEALRVVTGIAAPMLEINIDTDQIIPALFMGGTDAKGYGAHLFHHRRFLADGAPNPEFILNRPPYDRASRILLADRNFGCGSSRERAPKALREFGFRAIVAPSFGGIFYNNCWRNGIAPVELPIENVRRIASAVEASEGMLQVTVDLERQLVQAEGMTFPFEAPAMLRAMLLEGVDEIGLTLARRSEIEDFREKDRALRPWGY